MKNILAIETSSACCSVALATVQGHLFTREILGERVHHEALLPMIDQVLLEGALTGVDLQGILLSAGPGSFTGVRIGASVAQAFAFAQGLKILPLSSLWVLAQTAAATLLQSQEFSSQCLAVAVDARMKAAYCNEYELKWVQGRLIALPLSQDRLLAVSAYLDSLRKPQWLAGSAITPEVLDSNGFSQSQWIDVLPKARVMPMLLDYALDQGAQWLEPEEAQPIYIDDGKLYKT